MTEELKVEAVVDPVVEQEVTPEPVVEQLTAVVTATVDQEKEELIAFRTAVLATLGADSDDKAAGMLAALKEITAKYAELEEKLKSMLAQNEMNEADALISTAIEQGKVPPAKKAEVLGLYKKIGKDGLVSYLSMLPEVISLNNQINPPNNVQVEDIGLSATELEISRKFGFTPEEFAKHKIKCKSLKVIVETEEDK